MVSFNANDSDLNAQDKDTNKWVGVDRTDMLGQNPDDIAEGFPSLSDAKLKQIVKGMLLPSVYQAYITGVSMPNQTHYLNDIPAEEPPLRDPFLETEAGWLAPNGDYYGCNYEQGQRHETTAILIVEKFGLPISDDENDQEFLCRLGWIRVDIENIQFEQPMPTERQMNTLRQLALMGDNNPDWVRYYQSHLNLFIQHYEAKAQRSKNPKK